MTGAPPGRGGRSGGEAFPGNEGKQAKKNARDEERAQAQQQQDPQESSATPGRTAQVPSSSYHQNLPSRSYASRATAATSSAQGMDSKPSQQTFRGSQQSARDDHQNQGYVPRQAGYQSKPKYWDTKKPGNQGQQLGDGSQQTYGKGGPSGNAGGGKIQGQFERTDTRTVLESVNVHATDLAKAAAAKSQGATKSLTIEDVKAEHGLRTTFATPDANAMVVANFLDLRHPARFGV